MFKTRKVTNPYADKKTHNKKEEISKESENFDNEIDFGFELGEDALDADGDELDLSFSDESD